MVRFKQTENSKYIKGKKRKVAKTEVEKSSRSCTSKVRRSSSNSYLKEPKVFAAISASTVSRAPVTNESDVRVDLHEQMQKYSPKNVFSFVEVPFEFNSLPEVPLIEEIYHRTGAKKAQEVRGSVFLCDNLEHSLKLPPVIIGDFDRIHHRNTLFTPQVFSQWFEDEFVPHLDNSIPHQPIILLIRQGRVSLALINKYKASRFQFIVIPASIAPERQPLQLEMTVDFNQNLRKQQLNKLLSILESSRSKESQTWRNMHQIQVLRLLEATTEDLKQQLLQAWVASSAITSEKVRLGSLVMNEKHLNMAKNELKRGEEKLIQEWTNIMLELSQSDDPQYIAIQLRSWFYSGTHRLPGPVESNEISEVVGTIQGALEKLDRITQSNPELNPLSAGELQTLSHLVKRSAHTA